MLPLDQCLNMFETCLELTIAMPLWGLPLLALVILGIILGVGTAIRHLRSKVRELSNQTESLNARIERFTQQEREWTAMSEADQKLESELADLQELLITHQEKEKGWLASREAYYNFIYTVSHDMGTPLQTIETTLDNMRGYVLDEGGLRQQHHGIITTQTRRLSDLLENLKLLSRLETPNTSIAREPINLQELIEDTIMALLSAAEKGKIRLSYDCPSELALVFGDRDGLYRVLVNLVQNGIKYAKAEGGEVNIRVEEATDRLWIYIADDGIGIEPEHQSQIFSTAYRVPDAHSYRRSGSGLGLTIVKQIVEQHGSTIQVQSRPDEGTTFSFDLPIYTANAHK